MHHVNHKVLLNMEESCSQNTSQTRRRRKCERTCRTAEPHNKENGDWVSAKCEMKLASLTQFLCCAYVRRFCFIYCGLWFYAQSHSDISHVHAAAPCCAHVLAHGRPTMSYIPLVPSTFSFGTFMLSWWMVRYHWCWCSRGLTVHHQTL